MDDSRLLADNRLFLCINFAPQDHIQMAFDYWAGSIKDGQWVWAEAVKDIASRYRLKDSAVLQKVRETATAFDVRVRCSSTCHDVPRELSCRAEFRISRSRDFIWEQCKDQLRHQRTREDEERANILLWKKRAFLASLIARTTSFDYASISYA